MRAASLDFLVSRGLEKPAAEALLAAIVAASALPTPEERWVELSRNVLRPWHPFELHLELWRSTWPVEAGSPPPPAWLPSEEDLARSHLAPSLEDTTFEELHRRSVDEPEAFLQGVLRDLQIHCRQEPTRLLDLDAGAQAARWMCGAQLNIVESCFAGRDPEAVAVLWQQPDGPVQALTVAELRKRVDRVAWAVQSAGFLPGDALAACMPMNLESVVIYLGVVLSGCVVVSIADSFAPEEIATRLRISKARGIFTQDVILRGERVLPLYERVLEADAPQAIVLPAGDALTTPLRSGDLAWDDFLAGASASPFEPCIVDVETPINILFSSGTTGEPKAIPWTHATPIKAAADGRLHQDIHSGDVVAWPTNLGWMMGPWLIFASLLNGASIALYGGAPTGRGFCSFVQDARVTMLGLVPSLVRAWRSSNAVAGLDWTQLRCFSSTGEASGVEDYLWLMSRVPGYRPVVEYCGGTEIGGGYICGSTVQPQSPATFSTPAMGCDLLILDDNGQPTDLGEIALIAPIFGTSNRLLNRDHDAVYYAGMPPGPQGETLRRHGDQMEQLPGGWYRAQGRADDTMNLGGIKVSSAEIERAVLDLPGIVESAAVAISPPGGGPSRLVLYAVLDAATDPEPLQGLVQQRIRARLNPLFKLSELVPIESLPRTASGKVMRRVLRARHAQREGEQPRP